LLIFIEWAIYWFLFCLSYFNNSIPKDYRTHIFLCTTSAFVNTINSEAKSKSLKNTNQRLWWRRKHQSPNHELHQWYNSKHHIVWRLTIFFRQFQRTWLGCILKSQKWNILTSTNGTMPIQSLPPIYQQNLAYCLNTYCGWQSKGEILTCTTILGPPIGNTEFVTFYQNKTIQNLRNAVEAIHNLITDPQIAMTIFKISLHYTTYLLFTDMIHNENQSNTNKH